mgnify:CR=1 FL=1
MPVEPNGAGLRFGPPIPQEERLQHNREFRHRHEFHDWLTTHPRGSQPLVPPWRAVLTYATLHGVIPPPTRGRPSAERDRLLDNYFGPEMITLAKRLGTPASREDFAKRIYHMRDPHDPYVRPVLPPDPWTLRPPTPEPPTLEVETLAEIPLANQSMDRDDFAKWLLTKQQGRRYRPRELYREWRRPPPEKDHYLYEKEFLISRKHTRPDMEETLGKEFTRWFLDPPPFGKRRTPPEIIAKIEALRWTRMSSPSP